MAGQMNRILRHCYRLSDLAGKLEAAHPYARAVGSTMGVDFRRGFAEEGRTPPTQPGESKTGPQPGQSENLPGGRDMESEGAGPSQAADDSAATKLKAQGLLDFREVLDNTFKLLKSQTEPLVVENHATPISLLTMLSESIKASFSSWCMTKWIETSHNDEEFLAGAGDAFQTVFEMVHDKDWEGLEPMVSPGALKGFRQTYEEHAKHGLLLNFLPAQDVEPQSAIFSIKHKSMVARFDEKVEEGDEPPEENPPAASTAAPGTATAALDPPAPDFNVSQFFSRMSKPDPTKYYQIATVAFKARLEAEVKREEDGQVVLKSTDNRRQLWMFARGPLPDDLPRRELDLQWKLLAPVT